MTTDMLKDVIGEMNLDVDDENFNDILEGSQQPKKDGEGKDDGADDKKM